jgi:hypothetical protein
MIDLASLRGIQSCGLLKLLPFGSTRANGRANTRG